jgi:hypothetical protein
MSVSKENKILLQNSFGQTFAIPCIGTNGRADITKLTDSISYKRKGKLHGW